MCCIMVYYLPIIRTVARGLVPGDSLNVEPSTTRSPWIPRTLWSWVTTLPTWQPPWQCQIVFTVSLQNCSRDLVSLIFFGIRLTLALTLALSICSTVRLLQCVQFKKCCDCTIFAAIRTPSTQRPRSCGWLKQLKLTDGLSSTLPHEGVLSSF